MLTPVKVARVSSTKRSVAEPFAAWAVPRARAASPVPKSSAPFASKPTTARPTAQALGDPRVIVTARLHQPCSWPTSQSGAGRPFERRNSGLNSLDW